MSACSTLGTTHAPCNLFTPTGSLIESNGNRARAASCRVDEERIPFVHPQVSSQICKLLAIPALEDAVTEVLDNMHDMQAMEQQAQIQVPTYYVALS